MVAGADCQRRISDKIMCAVLYKFGKGRGVIIIEKG
jgi:hypothetical protein